MSMRLTQLRCKEVICVSSGERLGYVSDVIVELPQGNICSLIVPGPCKLWGLFGRREDYCIPWCKISQIGPDIVLVDIRVNECRVPRPKNKFRFF